MSDQPGMPTVTRPKRDVSDRNRAEVLGRGRCEYCRCRIGPFEVDHRVPLSRGGTSAPGNLACACVSCNTQKGKLLLHEWIQWRTSNGMFWPPIARHSTDPRHYPDHCSPCWHRVTESGSSNYPDAVAYQLEYDGGGGYNCYFRCECGNRWRVWYALGTWYYTDCPCNYCIVRRMEDEA
jgi:hypothetical protein